MSNFKCDPALLSDMANLYRRLDEQITRLGGVCDACGKCCDFESFGHRLYLTTPELLYFARNVPAPLRPMTGGVCPYRIDGRCSVYPWRFAGCRIFQCRTDPAAQSDLTEQTLALLKQICTQYDIPYRYLDLKTALASEEPSHG